MNDYPPPSPNEVVGENADTFYQAQQQQQQPSPQAQQSNAPNAEDLQLTAQLSRAIAPNMSTGTGADAPEGQDPRSHAPNVNHGLAAPQNYSPHLGSPHMASPQAPISALSGAYGASLEDPSRGGKRTKVSRACDECRRKKIRCDAVDNAPNVACTSCKRMNVVCEYSRIPQKRGPSKGYIKELADRVQTVEQRLHARGPEGDASAGPISYQQPPPDEYASQGRKRHHSMSGDPGGVYQQQTQSWTPQDPQRHQATATMSYEPSHRGGEPSPPNGLQSQPQWRNAPTLQHQTSSFESDALLDQTQLGTSRLANFELEIVHSFYNTIGVVYPLISTSPDNIISRVSSCPDLLKGAFYEALAAAVSITPSIAASDIRDAKHASQLMGIFQYGSNSLRDKSTNLVLLQTVILLVIEATNYPPFTTKGQNVSTLLSLAAGLAYSMKLHSIRVLPSDTESDVNSEWSHLARRVWLSLIIMDKWHAVGTGSPLFIPIDIAIIYPEDINLLGPGIYHLARLSTVVGYIALANLQPKDSSPMSLAPSIHGTMLRVELERCREALPENFINPHNAPLIHLVFHYIQIQLQLMLPEYEPKEILVPAAQIVAVLSQYSNYYFPITQHATALATEVLIDLRKFGEARSEAEHNLSVLRDGHIMPSPINSTIKEMIINNQRSDLYGDDSKVVKSQHVLTASQTLQQLAELATATTIENEGGDLHSQPRRLGSLQSLVRGGYLNKLGA